MLSKIVAVALVTSEDLALLGPNFNRAYPVNDVPCFGELLAAIDQADRELWRQRDKSEHGEIIHLHVGEEPVRV